MWQKRIALMLGVSEIFYGVSYLWHEDNVVNAWMNDIRQPINSAFLGLVLILMGVLWIIVFHVDTTKWVYGLALFIPLGYVVALIVWQVVSPPTVEAAYASSPP